MTLKQSNPHLKSAASRNAALRVSAQSSSAVEGIRAPFNNIRDAHQPKDTRSFTAYWKQRASTAR